MPETERVSVARFPHRISVKRLSSGYFHIRGDGPENWAQPPTWPCSEETLREHTATYACEDFILSALEAMPEVPQP